MTALSEFQRLEASGLWRANPDAQRIEVIVSIGDATLVITDMQERALTHWSLPAVERVNPGQRPAIYCPDGDHGETLELAEGEATMIDAIEKLRAAIERRRPHPGRLRFLILLGVCLAVFAGAVFWLPDAMRSHAVSVVPDVKRAELGDTLMRHIQRVSGPPCDSPAGRKVLAKLAVRIPSPEGPGQLSVMRDGVETAIHLPGGRILIGHGLVEDHDGPDVVAGYLVAERLRVQVNDPLADLLAHSGLWSIFRLLTTGDMDSETLRVYSETLLTTPRAALDDKVLLDGFTVWSVRSTPYAYAEDVSGERTLGLIEADPFATGTPDPVLSDADWLRLQNICGG